MQEPESPCSTSRCIAGSDLSEARTAAVLLGSLNSLGDPGRGAERDVLRLRACWASGIDCRAWPYGEQFAGVASCLWVGRLTYLILGRLTYLYVCRGRRDERGRHGASSTGAAAGPGAP